MAIDGLLLSDIDYRPSKYNRRTMHKKSVDFLGLDTEAYTTGKCFMVCVSDGGVFRADEIPVFFFKRCYINRKFAVYNLKYEEGAIFQNLPREKLEELRETLKTEHNGYKYRNIPRKCIRIIKGKNAVELYDIASFYNCSLDYASKKYLGECKIEIETKDFTPEYVKENWSIITEYCVKDAVLTKKLCDLLIRKFEGFGVYPQKLYSTAYISYKYFNSQCKIPLIKNIYDNHPELIQYAMNAYNGGKFEVTEKGSGKFWEYDIISAYPYEIANLVDIENAYIVESKKYRKGAIYGFIHAVVNIPSMAFSPLARKKGTINIYPVGTFEKYLTKTEFEYLQNIGCEVDIKKAYWIHVGRKVYPFKEEIKRLTKLKEIYGRDGKEHDRMIIKIFMNSLYGKFVQLIKKDDRYLAGRNWNIIFGSVITANCRVRITEMQQRFPEVIAVHTDSIISRKPLSFPKTGKLGEMVFEISGEGLILGTGVYQIGSKTKFRGFQTSIDLMETVSSAGKNLKITKKRPLSWREVVFHGWDTDTINQFVDITKKVYLNFDKKRIWFDDWLSYQEVLKRNVYSSPIPVIEF